MSADKISLLNVEDIKIADIVIGFRRRKKLGNIAGLARSIALHGLIHPILVRVNGDSQIELVTGGRRLQAALRLGWTRIPARRVDRLSDEELRAAEMDENAEREDLNDFERSAARLAELRQATAQAKAEATTGAKDLRGDSPHKSRGRPKEAGSKRAIAERTGVSRRTRQDLERHVALAEDYPFLKRPGWVMHSVLRAGEALEKLPQSERPKLGAMLDAEGIPPGKAIQVIEAMVERKPAERVSIYEASMSDNPHRRGEALAAAAKLPPLPDPAISLLSEMRHGGIKAARVCQLPACRQKIVALTRGVEKVLELVQRLDKARRLL